MVHILRITGNYSDEFDVQSIHEISQEHAEFLIETNGGCLNSCSEIYFGTNEFITLNELSVTLDTLTDDEYSIVKRALGCREFLTYGLINLTDLIEEARCSTNFQVNNYIGR